MSAHVVHHLLLRFRQMLATIGRAARRRISFAVMLAALSFGLVLEVTRPRSWRQPVRSEFRHVLRQSAGGGLTTSLVTAALTGLALVSQALYWLGLAGQQDLEASLLVTVLVR